MGWLYQNISRKQLIEQLTKPYQSVKKTDNELVAYSIKCLKKCFRGNICYKGTLWAVFENQSFNYATNEYRTQRYIMCFLFEYHTGQWGYKEIDESIHPYYYNCPISYLKLVTEQNNGVGINNEWREIVTNKYNQKKQISLSK